MTAEIVEGDIFRWRYKDERPEHRRDYGRYHCKSQIAIARSGASFDTFWSTRDDNSACWTFADATERLELDHLGNMGDLEKRQEHYRAYYDDADIVDINHANSSTGNFYIRKGAARSRTKIQAVLLKRIENTEEAIAYSQRMLEQQRKTLAEIDAGIDLDKVWL